MMITQKASYELQLICLQHSFLGGVTVTHNPVTLRLFPNGSCACGTPTSRQHPHHASRASAAAGVRIPETGTDHPGTGQEVESTQRRQAMCTPAVSAHAEWARQAIHQCSRGMHALWHRAIPPMCIRGLSGTIHMPGPYGLSAVFPKLPGKPM